MNHLQNQNINKLRKLIYDNEDNFVSILSDITKIEIEKVDSIELIKCPKIIKDEIFLILKLRAKIYDYVEIEIYLKIINESQLEKIMSYYWILIYEEEFIKEKRKSLKEKIIKNKINIQKINEERFTDTFLLEIENNETNILKYGSLVYFTEFNKYLISKQKKLTKEFSKENILFIGIKNNKGMNNFSIKVHS